jgi:hypothetical protein
VRLVCEQAARRREELACTADEPCPIGLGHDAGDLHRAGLELDDEEHVKAQQAAQGVRDVLAEHRDLGAQAIDSRELVAVDPACVDGEEEMEATGHDGPWGCGRVSDVARCGHESR